MVLVGPLQLRIFYDSMAPGYCSASVLCPSAVISKEGTCCDGHQPWLPCPRLRTRLASAGIQVLQTLGFCLTALVSTSDGYFGMLPFLNKKTRLELRTEGLWCGSLRWG